MSRVTIPSPPTRQYWVDRQWVHDNYSSLVRDHANQWVAVHQEKVLAVSADLGKAEDSARAQCSDPDIVYQFIDDGSMIF